MPRKKETEILPATETAKKMKLNVSLSNLIWALLLLLALSAAGYFYYQTKFPEKLSQEQEKEDLVQELGQFLDLPADETPTLATVTDREKLADQPFFAQAENGDRVLIYSKSGKAILYRPSTKKVIDMTTTSIAENQAGAPAEGEAATDSEPVTAEPARVDLTVTILNGGTKSGVTPGIEKKIADNLKDYTVEKKDNASKSDYQGILIIDREGDQSARAQELAELLGGQIVSMPEGENETSDIVIIVGNES